MNKNKTLSEQLKAYSLLAGSLFASSLAANGQVIYTDVNPDKELGGVNPGNFPSTAIDTIDMNNDGIFDFKVSLKMYGMLGTGFSFQEKIDGSFNFSNAVITYTVEYKPLVFKISSCDTVPPPYLYGFNHGYFAFQFASGAGYFWQDVHDKYVGLKFKVGNDLHYGWLRLDVNTADTVPNIIIKDYAYEQTPNKKISVCDTGLGQADAVAIVNAEQKMSLYPNPSSGMCVIKFGQPLNGDIEIRVTDSWGKEVHSETISQAEQHNQISFDFSNLASGVYFVQVKSQEESITQKWIRN